jgi:iron complex transport system ATP-binding protein
VSVDDAQQRAARGARDAGASSAAAALRFERVSVAIGAHEILREVSLEVRPGEIVTLAGPNGAGKTTLLRVASRLLTPAAGRVLVRGRPLESLSRRALARELAVVPQDATIAFPFTAGEVVLMGRSPHLGMLGFETRDDVERARQAMDRVGIEALAGRSILELSGGERQLVLLARALAQDPQVLLLDEPTAHLDLRHRVAVLAQLQEFVRGGRSALVVSHDLGLAASTCDRLALLRSGELVASGEPRAVLSPGALREVFGVEAEVVSTPDGGLAVLPRAPALDEESC